MNNNNILSSNAPIVKSQTTDMIFLFKKHLNFSIISLIILIIIIFYILSIVNESKKQENEQKKKIFRQNFTRLITLLVISIFGFLLIATIHIYNNDNHLINSIASLIIFTTAIINYSFENNKLKKEQNEFYLNISITLIVVSCLTYFIQMYSRI